MRDERVHVVQQPLPVTIPHFIQSLFFIPHLSPAVPPSISPMILLGWTLNYEMFFYAVFAVAMAVSVVRRVPLAMTVLVILPVLGAFSVFDGSPAGEFYSNNLVLEFVFGMMLATLFLNGVLDRVGAPGGAILIAIGAIGLCVGGYHFELLRALVFGVPAALIVAGALSLEAARNVPKRQPFLLLGDSSYSIYLAHLFPIAVLRFAWSRLGLPTEGIVPVFSFMTIALAGGALAGVTSYLLLERPMLQFMRRPRRAQPPVPISGRIPAASTFAQ
jgi:exopolysaccharide production protein ExoZ